jgi:hypothetical protein
MRATAPGISSLELGLAPDRQVGLSISWAARQLAAGYSGVPMAPIAQEFEPYHHEGQRELDSELAATYTEIAEKLDIGLAERAELQLGSEDLPFFRDALRYHDDLVGHLRYVRTGVRDASVAVPDGEGGVDIPDVATTMAGQA